MDTPFIVTYFLSFAGLSGAIYGLFAKAGENVKNDSKKVVSRWLQNISLDKDSPNWPATFASLFDRVFTERHLSWKCFLRSSLASIISVFILFMIYNLKNEFDMLEEFMDDGVLNGVLIVVILLGLNIIPDYLSLLQSRYIIKLLSKSSSVFKQCIYLFVDLILTGAIVFSWMFVLVWIVGGRGISQAWLDYKEPFLESLDLVMPTGLLSFGVLDWYGILFYSTFFTSIWIWLFFSSGLVIKVLSGGKKFFAFFQKHLNIEENPFKAMGFVLIILLSLVYLIGGGIMLIT